MTTSDPDSLARWEQLGRFSIGTSDVPVALACVTQELDRLQVPYAVCGGLAVDAHGYQRTTIAVDLPVTAAGLPRFEEHALGLGWLENLPGRRGVCDSGVFTRAATDAG